MSAYIDRTSRHIFGHDNPSGPVIMDRMNATALIPRVEFARKLGRPVRTLDRWARLGCHGVKLVPRAIGDRLYYTMGEYEEWQERVNEARAFARRRDWRPDKRKAKRDEAELDSFLRRQGLNI